jgi:hypothetical protein
MLKQRVFFFAAHTEGRDTMANLDDLRQMAANYVSLYGESCLSDPDTPSFVRTWMAQKSQADMPQAG